MYRSNSVFIRLLGNQIHAHRFWRFVDLFAVSRIGLRIFSIHLFCIGSFAMAEPAGEKAQILIDTFKFPETAILAEAMLCEELAARLGSEKHVYWRDKVDEETAMMLSEETAKYIAESVPPAVDLAIIRNDKEQLAANIRQCGL